MPPHAADQRHSRNASYGREGSGYPHTNVTAVAPSVTVTAGAVVSPVPGEVVNLTVPVVYTVTLGEETSRYTVTVTFERSVSQQLWDELGNNSDVADHQTSHTKRDWS